MSYIPLPNEHYLDEGEKLDLFSDARDVIFAGRLERKEA